LKFSKVASQQATPAGLVAAGPDHSGTFCRIFWFVVYVASLHLLLSGTLLSELPAGRAEFPEGERQQQAIGGPFPNFP